MAMRGGELLVAYTTFALTLAATGPGTYRIGQTLPGKLTSLGVLVGGAVACALIAKMVSATSSSGQEAAPAAATLTVKR